MARKNIEGNMPEAKFGRGTITAAVFANIAEKEGKKIAYRQVQLQKSFRRQTGEWETRQISLSSSELLRTALYLAMCAQYIETNPLPQTADEELPEDAEMVEEE